MANDAWLQSLPRDKGSYILLLRLSSCRVTIGRLGERPFAAGHYAYVGSAFGPGGLRARLSHHCRPSARPHWHLDYLQPFAELEAIWLNASGERLEHHWAGLLAEMAGVSVAIERFGASDCRCPSHFFYSELPFSLVNFRRLNGAVMVEALQPN